MPAGAIYVGRPTRWGNPFRVTRSSAYHGLAGSWFVLDEHGTTYHPEENTQRAARQRAVDLFAHALSEGGDAGISLQRIRDELAGHDLVCWCPSAEPCHADVLLTLANDRPIAAKKRGDEAVDPSATRRQHGSSVEMTHRESAELPTTSTPHVRPHTSLP